VSAARIAALEKLVNEMAAEELAARGGDPSLAGLLLARVAERMTRASLSADGAQLVKEWYASRANVVPFRPKAEEAGA
jgi:hypothetical protein